MSAPAVIGHWETSAVGARIVTGRDPLPSDAELEAARAARDAADRARLEAARAYSAVHPVTDAERATLAPHVAALNSAI